MGKSNKITWSNPDRWEFSCNAESDKWRLKTKYPHLSDDKIDELYNMIDAVAYLMVEERGESN